MPSGTTEFREDGATSMTMSMTRRNFIQSLGAVHFAGDQVTGLPGWQGAPCSGHTWRGMPFTSGLRDGDAGGCILDNPGVIV